MEGMTRQETREAQKAIWTGHIERQRQSGKGIKVFCEEAGLKVWQFAYWRGVLNRKAVGGAGFVEVKVRGGSGLAVEIGGCRIHVGAGFDPDLLRQVLAVVRLA